jgi:hypothetical protein
LNNNIPINWTIPTSYKAMHETKSPHMNHIHQHKSHNTIDLDLQSLYSISIKGITMIVCSKLFSQNSKLTNKRKKLTYLYTRGAHGLLKEGAPSVRDGLPSVRRNRVPLLHHLSTSVNQNLKPRRGRHFLQQRAATSRGRHLSKRGAPPFPHVLKSKKICNQSNPIKCILSPLTS